MRRIVRAIGLAFAGLILIVGLTLGGLIWQIDRAGRRDDAAPADAVVVLGARVEWDGRPSADLASRVAHAIEVWRAGYAPNFICTGGFRNERLSAAAVCRRLALHAGVADDRIFLADGTTNTAEDARAAAQVMAQHGWRTAIVVSHPLHIFRTLWLFRRAGVDATASPTSTRVDDMDLLLRLWYTMREAGAVIATVLDGWGWLPTGWRIQLQNFSHGLP
ncbi:MAG: YdcF family protein [Anaerolineae bacterium]